MWMNEWNENNNKKICIEWLYTFIIFIIIVFFRNFLFCFFPRFRSDGLPDEERARGTIVNWGLGVVGLCLVEWHSNKNNEIKYDFFCCCPAITTTTAAFLYGNSRIPFGPLALPGHFLSSFEFKVTWLHADMYIFLYCHKKT